MSTVPYIFAGNTGNIPLSQLDANFANTKLSVDFVINPAQANITSLGTLTGLSASGNVLIAGITSLAGNVTANSNLTVTANVTAGNIRTTGLITATGNITGANILSTSSMSATSNVIAGGNVTGTNNVIGGNLLTAGTMSAAGNAFANVLTANVIVNTTFNGQDISLTGNIVVDGNATVNGNTTFINTQSLTINDKNIVVANNVSTSALIDGAGIDAGNPTVAYIRYANASQAWTTANNFSVGGNLSVTGNAFATTAANGTSNTQLATTRFVDNTIINLNLSTMSTQASNNVSITGGSISGIADLAIADGGTGTSSFTANVLLLGNGFSSFQELACGNSGNILLSNGNTWVSNENNAFGPGQSWQNVTGSRSTGVTYTNSTNKPIFVIAQVGNQTNGVYVYINGTLLIRHWYDVNGGAGQIGYSAGEFIVGPGDTYNVQNGPLQQWWEYRA